MNPNEGNYTENREHTHWVGTALEKTGRFLTRPASLFLTDGVRLIRPIKPQVGDQASSYTKELGCRFLYGARAITLLALNLVLSPLELLGSGMRFIATQFFRKEVVWIKPTQVASENDEAPKTQVKVATFNIAGMPSFIGVHNNCGEMDRARQKAIADLINGMDDDVVCLQEAFENFGPIAELVKEKFPHILYDVARNHHVRLGSGLVILSKYPIKTFQYQRHPCAGGLDDMARKGVLAATITLPGGRPFCIFNTHLNAGASPTKQIRDGSCDYRMLQLEYMKKFISQHVANELRSATQKPVVIGAGDLNIGPTEKNKKTGENPTKLDLEWFDKDRRNPSGAPSAFREIMAEDYYDAVTNRFFQDGWKGLLKNEKSLAAKVKNISDFDQQKILATSIEMDDAPVAEQERPKHPVLGVQQLDHVFAIRNRVFGENDDAIAKLQLKPEDIQVQDITQNLISDHAPLHVTYTIQDDTSSK